jgi:serine protease inhibitor
MPTHPVEPSGSLASPAMGIAPPATDRRLTAANQKFGFKLLGQLVAQDAERNLLVSPTSVLMALSMLYNGAAGSTQQAIAKTLELQDRDLSYINQANADLIAALESNNPAVKLSIANSLWGREGVVFKPEFLRQNQEFYQAEVTSLDFSSPDAPGRINAWVSQNTNGKIPKIIDQIDPAQILFLINAVYFKGDWMTQFDPAKTAQQPFYLLDGSQKQHPMMSQQGRNLYLETDQFQAISLPYYSSGHARLSMYIFLPKPSSSLSAFYQSLNAENWNRWISQFSRPESIIQLPKFTFGYGADLIPALKAMGMGEAFGDQADFSNLSDGALQVNQVRHKSFIEVNETGTEAAAVTSAGVRTTSIDLTPPIQMIVNRPFFFVINDNMTNNLLFMGSVIEPS